MVVVRLLILSAVLCARAEPQPSAPHNPLGPGPDPHWQITPPEAVGLSTARLLAAVEEVAQVGTQLCLAVVKDGALVLDHTFESAFTPGGQPRLIESMSAGKTITAALVGVAVGRGLFDIDVPLAHYGVPRAAVADWNRVRLLPKCSHITQ